MALARVLMLSAVLGLAACGDSGSGTTEAPGDALASAAQAGADRYIAAEEATDVEGVFALLQTSLTDKERQRYGFFAAWPTHRVRDCAVTEASDFRSAVTCQADLADPVWRHLGATGIVITYNTWSDGMTFDFGGDYTGDGVVATPDTYADTITAYADYLRANQPDAYAASCDPQMYDVNATVQEFGLTLVPACGELVASAGEAAAAWLEAGKPAP